jgi:manganese efflux pump family protein
MLALLAVAASLGLTNFGAAVGIGLSGVDARTRLRVGLVFGAFETAMPIIGLVIGSQTAAPLGHDARWVAAGLLVALGIYGLVISSRGYRPTGQQLRGSGPPAPERHPDSDHSAGPGLTRLVIAGLALSMDNLVVGFALGTYHTSVVIGAVIIGAVSVALSLIGLELGARMAGWVGRRGEQLAALVLIALGVAIAARAVS